MRSSATFQAPKEKVYTILNIGCFDCAHPHPSSCWTVLSVHRGGELSLFGPAVKVCLAAGGVEVFHNWGMLQFMLETCDHKVTGEDRTSQSKGRLEDVQFTTRSWTMCFMA